MNITTPNSSSSYYYINYDQFSKKTKITGFNAARLTTIFKPTTILKPTSSAESIIFKLIYSNTTKYNT